MNLRTCRHALVACALLALSMPLARGADAEEPWTGTSFGATVVQPRAFGYMVGDLLSQRVLLQLEGDAFVPRKLPAPGRASAWFERRAARIENDRAGRAWLVVDYQVINAPASQATVTLPSWKLAPAAGDRGLLVDEYRIGVSAASTRPRADADPMDTLRPDRAAPPQDLHALRLWIAAWTSAAPGVLIAWLAWLLWRNARETASQPFAQALRQLRRMDETSPEAWKVLHRAFDRTGGRALHAGSLGALFSKAPHLEPMRPRIEAFFSQSVGVFFGGRQAAQALSVRGLCSDLRQVEKRHSR